MDIASQPDRRRFLRDGAYLAAAGALFAGEASGAIYIDQQNPANLWTRTLRNVMTGEKA